MQTRYYLLLIITLFHFSCNEQVKQNKTAISNTPVIAPAPVYLIMNDSAILNSDIDKHLVYQDSICWGHPVVLNKLQTKLLINSPTFLWQAIFWNNQDYRMLYFVYPGEKISVSADKKGLLNLSIPGNTQRTKELNFFKELVIQTGNIYNFSSGAPYHSVCSNIQQLQSSAQQIFDVKNKRLQYLDSFSKSSPVSNSFYQVAINTIESAALKDSLLLYWNNRNLLSKQNLYKPFIQEKLQTVRLISYQPYLVYFNACKSLVSMATTKYLYYEPQDSLDVVNQFMFIQNNLQDTLRDFLLANTLYTGFQMDIPVSEECLQQFNATSTIAGYKTLIAEKQIENNDLTTPKGNSNVLLADGKTTKTIQELLLQYKGKLVLLDFWASWCAPCRAEMPYSEQLMKEYGGKNVAFVYISTDESIQDWKNAVAEEDLPAENSYLLINGNTSEFAKQNGIQSIPRYILIGKDSKIINVDAPRPSDAKLKALLNKNL